MYAEGTFTLQDHTDQNLSTEELIEQIAQYFAHISQGYPPLDPDALPQCVRDILMMYVNKLKNRKN